jgi:sterol desaturase/sphingolipid hydroxylase (fatty acid hydroxylase superfamily)
MHGTDETFIRLGTFLILLAVMGAAESLFPRRPLTTPKTRRWLTNLSLAALSTLIPRLLLPMLPVALAASCQAQGLGLLNIVPLPDWLALAVSLIALDLLIYGQHVAFHKVRLLWRIHRMHHADLDLDTSTGIRFHPIEIFLSTLLKLGAVFLLGPPVEAVVIFEIVLNGLALFNHANLWLPMTLDRVLRLLLVTPDMHRVHHSTNMREANTNFGFNLSLWDRLFTTYKPQPDLGHTGMHIGLSIFRDKSFGGLWRVLTIPFL